MESKYGSLLLLTLSLKLSILMKASIGNQRGKNALAKVVVLSFKWPFLGTVIPRICLVALKLVQPFLIQDAIKFINNTRVASSNTTGYGLIAAYGLVYLGIAVLIP